jgi:cob(I)alamin adenosyltransferase
MIILFTGAGKGKTSAALGTGLRALGHGRKVKMITFMKGNSRFGELKAVQMLKDFEIMQTGLVSAAEKGNPVPEHMERSKLAIEKAADIIHNKQADLLILDEIHVALQYGLVSLNSVLELIRKKPENMDIILTGERAPLELVKDADIVSEILDLKHPYQKGIKARKGIDY